ncbi:winged helix-turn-helix domain-containing protein [Halorubrum sp. RMP-47]|uniref:ArsR/SmtB family transcription factor n=1 Tax=Halorubrum miltondacostae TaxID=3076378 RepID=UPI00352768EE
MAARKATLSGPSYEDDPSPPAAELLDLFGDEYTRKVFKAVSDEPRGGRAVAEEAGVSRPTAYRRLNALKDAGLVTSKYQIAADGHHREQFIASAEHLSVSLDGGDIEAVVEFN